MRFKSLKIEARGANGWESPKLLFGERTTSLFAKNGSGKTPLVQAIPFCLGFPTKFREDISSKCASATLTIEHDNALFELRRSIGSEFHATINPSKGTGTEYFTEGDFSDALFKIFNLSPPALVSTSKAATRPYVSTVLPLFYLKQDGGYLDAYKPPALFITDQFVEMVRFCFALNPKHSFQAKKDLLEAKDALESANRRLVFQQKKISDLSTDVDDSTETSERLKRSAEALSLRLGELRETVDAQGSANSALLELYQGKDEQLRASNRLSEELTERIGGIDSIRSEIEGEIKTLALNEESRRIFDSFQEICANRDCGLFIGSSESYAKNLLYLKDQLKDLQRNADRAQVRLDDLLTRIGDQEREREVISRKLREPSSNQGVQQLVSAVQEITRKLIDTEQQRSAIEALRVERSKLLRFEEDRSKIQDRIALLTANGRSDLEFNKLRMAIRDLTVKWMDILDTQNVSADVDIDLEFRFKFGNEPLDVFTGSTRIRLVLAIHAALFEQYLLDADRPFRFLILDTPKQHEMHTSDLAKFLNELENLGEIRNAQILLSSTEYRHPIGKKDQEWLPQYPGAKQPMYLGSPPKN